jgi:hypothetical protein
MGVALLGQVQRSVSWMQVLLSRLAIGHATHLDFAEDGHQMAMMAGLDPGPWGAGRVGDASETLFALGTDTEMVLEQSAEQLPAAPLETVLEVAVLEAGGLLPVQEGHRRLEVLTRRGEAIVAAVNAGAAHRWLALRACTRATRSSSSPRASASRSLTVFR